MGIMPQELTPELAESWGIMNTKGILVGSVSNDTPASEAGFRVKDVITTFDGKAVDDVQRFRLLVADTPVKKKVKFDIVRGGEPRELYITLSERPPDEEMRRQQVTPASWLGIAVEPLTGDFARENEIREKDGVVVVEVEPGSGADGAGLERGDVIKEVNDKPVKDTYEYNDAIEQARGKNPKKPIVLLIKRGDSTQFIAVQPEE
jgi:serine protease Do